MSWADSEQDVAAPMVERLRADGWDVFQEVPVPGGRIDIVARRSAGDAALYYGLEVKRSFGFRLLDQAIGHTPWFHFVAAVVPRARRGTYATRAARAVRDRYGLGLWTVRADDGFEQRVREVWSPRLHRPGRQVEKVERYLFEAQKHYEAAGSASGSYWSPWRETGRRVREHVAAHPGCTLEELTEAVDHHYQRDSTFRSLVVRDVRDGKIDGVQLDDGGASARFVPSADPGVPS